MAHDLVIRRGLVVAGTAAMAYEGDVAGDADRITVPGEVDATVCELILENDDHTGARPGRVLRNAV